MKSYQTIYADGVPKLSDAKSYFASLLDPNVPRFIHNQIVRISSDVGVIIKCE
ncbi:10660_t:CDS:1, partial [Diversispora eburnea]